MASSSSSIEAGNGGKEQQLRPSRFTKKTAVLALVGGTLIVGAVFGGVFGSRAVEKKRRVPIKVEDVTYAMVTEGFMNAAVVPVPQNILQKANTSSASSPALTTLATGDKAPAGNPLQGETSIFSFDYWFGDQGIAGIPMFDPMPLVLPPEATTIPSWVSAAQFRNTEGRVLCYASTGKEVIEMVSGDESPCEVIVLTNDRFTPYSIDKIMNVTKPKIIIGRPIYAPMLNCTNQIPRLFEVYPGGQLETRSVILVRGFGRNVGLNGNEINLTIGTIIRVQVGGQFMATGCMFRERNNTFPNFLDEVRRKLETPTARNRQFGQMTLVLGGNLVLLGCRSLRFRPFGNGVLNTMVIGRDINVVAGTATLIGHCSGSSSLWSTNYFMTGALATVMGGVLTFIGGNNIGANLLQVQGGTMVNFGTFAGVLVTVGYGYTTVKGLLFRSIAGQFGTIAGVSVQIAFVRGSADGVRFVAGAGHTHATFTGVNNRQTGVETGYMISGCLFGVGGSNYVGAGSSFFQAIPKASSAVTDSKSGVGLTSYYGAGSSTNSYVPGFSAILARFNTGIGTDFFMGAGWHNNINCTRFSYQLANSFIGLGNQGYVGFGGAAFIRSYSASARVYQYKYPTIYTFTVAGTGVGSSGTKGQNLVLTKGGITRYIHNKTTNTVTKISTPHVQKTLAPTRAPGVRRRRTVARKRAVQTEDLKNIPPTMGSWLKNIVDATGGLDPGLQNKIVMLQTTILERKVKLPPHPKHFRDRRLKERSGGYAKILADGLVDFEGSEAVETPGLISANNSDCFLCNVGPGNTADHIGGPGACEVKDVCGDSNNPAEIYARAQESTTTNILPPALDKSLGNVDEDGNPILSDTWILWHEMVVYCQSTDPETEDSSITRGCLTEQYIKDVIRGYILLDNVKNEYQMAVSESGVHASADAFPDPTLDDLKVAVSPEWNPECQGWTKYDIRMVANDPEVEQHILDIFEGFVEDPSDLETTIIENADPSAELQPCAIRITEKGEQRYPSINSMPAFKPSRRLMIGPDVVIADGVSIEPVKFLYPGETYVVYLQNFPKGATIEVMLMDGLVQTGPVVATLDSFAGDGIAEVSWTVPRDIIVNDGKYYLKAQIKNLAAFFTYSQVFYFDDGYSN